MNTNTMIALILCTLFVVVGTTTVLKAYGAKPNVVRVECPNGIATTNVEHLPNGAERVLVICNPKGKLP